MLNCSFLRNFRRCATKSKLWQIISISFAVLTENFYVVPFTCKLRFSFGGKFKFTKETLNYKKTRPLLFLRIKYICKDLSSRSLLSQNLSNSKEKNYKCLKICQSVRLLARPTVFILFFKNMDWLFFLDKTNIFFPNSIPMSQHYKSAFQQILWM